MQLAFAFIGLPIATYLVLATLSRGRPAIIGIIGAAALTGVLFLSQMWATNGYTTALCMLVFSSIALAALVQVVRLAIGEGRSRWLYPVIVVLALLGAGLPMLYILHG